MAEWFSALVNGLRVKGLSPDGGKNPCDLKTLSVNPTVNRYLIQFKESSKGSRRRGTGWAPPSTCCALDTVPLIGSLQLQIQIQISLLLFLWYKLEFTLVTVILTLMHS